MREHAIQRPRHLGEVQRFDEQTRVAQLAAAAASHEATQLLFGRASPPGRLPLERAEGAEISLSLDDPFDGGRAERADQLVLQVRDAHVEAEPLHLVAAEIDAEAGPLEAATEVGFLRGVAQAREPHVGPSAEPIEHASDRLRAPDRHDGNSLGVEVPALTQSEGLERQPVAEPLDEHDRARDEGLGNGVYRTSAPLGRTTSHVPPCVTTFWHLTSPAFSWA